MWAAQFCKSIRERQWLSSGGAGTMGYGFPAAIGAQLGESRGSCSGSRWRRRISNDHARVGNGGNS